ncbi:glycine betaine ABC transporter substrate-binding protein [Candidatus Poriferisocius sp.]|uniref:glycine betaine ABC transporter substrate-binding protein n=1 Tax=Candidatus Poriferisocius sp. TaxID=3101276 RepID=UPI003B02EB86
MARADWSTGYMQAAIYHHLLEELGYDVSEPADLELSPANAYVAMAEGAFDFWVNSWYPNHDPFLNGEMPDGSLVNQHVSVVGEEMLAGGLEGLMTNKSLVEEHGIRTLDQIMGDDALFELYESTDPNPGDGVLQILGCIEGWGCHVALAETIELAGYADRLEQLEVGGYDAIIAEAVARVEDGTPFIAYTWTPSGYVTQLIPGVNVMWLAHEADKVHDGSTDNPGFAVAAPASLGTDVCTNDPCWLFRNSADIKVTANNDFLTSNPAAARLLELVQISVVDVALQNVRYDGGEDTTDDVNSHAAEWIADNRDTVDGWLAEARSATEFMVTPAAAADDMNMTPGEGVSVAMARADWSTGYMQAAIYAALLQELGYDVSEPADLELSPSNAYVAMAEGAFDFWANSWYPNHDPFLNGEMPDGSLVNQHVSVVGEEMLAGGLEGLMTNKSLVEEHGIATFDQIVNDDALFELYESTDPNPGDGVLQILGCIEGWGCHVALAETIELAGYADRVEQLEVGGYDAIIAEAVARVEDGTPFIAYTWTPSGYVTQLIPGVNVMWLAHEADKVHDGSTDNPGFAVAAPASLGTDVCTNDPCWLFRNSADIKVTANNDFLGANPSAARLLELVQISVVDVAIQNVRYDGGEDTTDDVNRHAAEWIADNRDTVDAWLAEARSAG